MAYVEYNYGSYRIEIRKLLRKRLTAKDRISHHKKKVEKWEKKVIFLEADINAFLKKAENSVG